MRFTTQEKYESRAYFRSESVSDGTLSLRIADHEAEILANQRALRILLIEKEKRDKKAKKVFLLAEKLAKLAGTSVSLENSFTVRVPVK